jgi:hypothetical protein
VTKARRAVRRLVAVRRGAPAGRSAPAGCGAPVGRRHSRCRATRLHAASLAPRADGAFAGRGRESLATRDALPHERRRPPDTGMPIVRSARCHSCSCRTLAIREDARLAACKRVARAPTASRPTGAQTPDSRFRRGDSPTLAPPGRSWTVGHDRPCPAAGRAARDRRGCSTREARPPTPPPTREAPARGGDGRDATQKSATPREVQSQRPHASPARSSIRSRAFRQNRGTREAAYSRQQQDLLLPCPLVMHITIYS